MIKLAGGLLVLYAFTNLGFLVGARYLRRTVELRQLQLALKTLQSEIGYTLTPLPEALDRVGRLTGGRVGQIFERAGLLLRDGRHRSVAEAWTGAIEEEKRDLALAARDLAILRELGNRFGGVDRKGHEKHLEQAMERLWQEELSSLQAEKEYVRLWRYLGLLGGLAVVFLLA
ncbi:MAG: stage III sporulation protein AB [Firmicutes bacterium]|nr:stage III sporulation protein AB [Bacillota bacterium]MCL5039106.1 stage III sporulation protein AB [Bacillota bacterium]